MTDMQFRDSSFDILWCEGAIYVIGFEEGLRTWRRFLRHKAFLAVHAKIVDVEKRIDSVSSCGYNLLNTFKVPKESWWDDYYGPMENLVEGLRHRYQNYPDALALLDKVLKEVEEFKTKPENHGSVFYVMQRTGE
jgi:ubiquinone/menaquinone biosynthesis C-methylase UbiE